MLNIVRRSMLDLASWHLSPDVFQREIRPGFSCPSVEAFASDMDWSGPLRLDDFQAENRPSSLRRPANHS